LGVACATEVEAGVDPVATTTLDYGLGEVVRGAETEGVVIGLCTLLERALLEVLRFGVVIGVGLTLAK